MNLLLFGKIVPLSGGRAACGGGGKVQFMRVVPAGTPAWIFLDRRTEVHKAKKDGRGTVNKVNGLAAIDGWSQAEPCDNVEH